MLSSSSNSTATAFLNPAPRTGPSRRTRLPPPRSPNGRPSTVPNTPPARRPSFHGLCYDANLPSASRHRPAAGSGCSTAATSRTVDRASPKEYLEPEEPESLPGRPHSNSRSQVVGQNSPRHSYIPVPLVSVSSFLPPPSKSCRARISIPSLLPTTSTTACSNFLPFPPLSPLPFFLPPPPPPDAPRMNSRLPLHSYRYRYLHLFLLLPSSF